MNPISRPSFLDRRRLVIAALLVAGLAAPLLMRVLRSSLMEVAQEDYVTMARLRGLSERQILVRHAFKNAFLPTLTLMGVQFSFLFGGTLLVEVIYGYPGIGNMMVEAVRNADLPIIQGVALVYAVAVLVMRLLHCLEPGLVGCAGLPEFTTEARRPQRTRRQQQLSCSALCGLRASVVNLTGRPTLRRSPVWTAGVRVAPPSVRSHPECAMASLPSRGARGMDPA